MKSRQATFSYSTSRRSAQLVATIHRRLPKKVNSSSGTPNGVKSSIRNARKSSSVRCRRAPHRAGDVLVEIGEESKAVFAGKRETAVPTRIRNRNTAGLAAEHRFALVDMHLEAALRQCMRGAQARDPSAENSHRVRHFVILRRNGGAPYLWMLKIVASEPRA